MSNGQRRVQLVYGDEHVAHLEQVLIPSLRTATSQQVDLRTRNYSGRSGHQLTPFEDEQIKLTDVQGTASRPLGFAAHHNELFRSWETRDDFVLLNPDCVMCDGSIDRLYERKSRSGTGTAIVEGRQWPFEHPKEYDPVSLETPWASGAFALIDGEFFQSVNGMEEAYFLYEEDVDLSWQAWMNGWRVIYEPTAAVVHFTGGPFYRSDLEYDEQYLGQRNFIALLYKYFGAPGERLAVRLLTDELSANHAVRAHLAFERDCKHAIAPLARVPKHDQIKVLGVNRFHELRQQ